MEAKYLEALVPSYDRVRFRPPLRCHVVDLRSISGPKKKGNGTDRRGFGSRLPLYAEHNLVVIESGKSSEYE